MSYDLNDWSIDLETLDNTPSSAVVSIGMVQFDRETGEVGVQHQIHIDLDDAMRHGSVSGSTLSWWLTRVATFMVQHGDEPRTTAIAIQEMCDLIRSKSVGPRLWGNGASFDLGNLENMAVRSGMRSLFASNCRFPSFRDMRTTVDDADLNLRDLPSVGVAHCAMDDALFQSQAISLARRRIRQALGFTSKPWQGLPAFSQFDTLAPITDEDDEL